MSLYLGIHFTANGINMGFREVVSHKDNIEKHDLLDEKRWKIFPCGLGPIFKIVCIQLKFVRNYRSFIYFFFHSQMVTRCSFKSTKLDFMLLIFSFVFQCCQFVWAIRNNYEHCLSSIIMYLTMLKECTNFYTFYTSLLFIEFCLVGCCNINFHCVSFSI